MKIIKNFWEYLLYDMCLKQDNCSPTPSRLWACTYHDINKLQGGSIMTTYKTTLEQLKKELDLVTLEKTEMMY